MSDRATWVIARKDSGSLGIGITKFNGDKEKAELILLAVIMQDIERNKDTFSFGTNDIEQIRKVSLGHDNALAGYACFKGRIIEYTAYMVDVVEDKPQMETVTEFNEEQCRRIDEIEDALNTFLQVLTQGKEVEHSAEYTLIAEYAAEMLIKKGYRVYFPTIIENNGNRSIEDYYTI